MKLTRLIEEGKWSECPTCGDTNAHQSFMGKWECTTEKCPHYSKRQATEKGLHSQPASPLVQGPSSGQPTLPTQQEWRDLQQRSVSEVKTNIGRHVVVTIFGTLMNPGSLRKNGYQTMVFLQSTKSLFLPQNSIAIVRETHDLASAEKAHGRRVDDYNRGPKKQGPNPALGAQTSPQASQAKYPIPAHLATYAQNFTDTQKLEVLGSILNEMVFVGERLTYRSLGELGESVGVKGHFGGLNAAIFGGVLVNKLKSIIGDKVLWLVCRPDSQYPTQTLRNIVNNGDEYQSDHTGQQVHVTKLSIANTQDVIDNYLDDAFDEVIHQYGMKP